MKLLFITVVVLVIPGFFVFVFAMSTINKLASLRNRCREALQRANANTSEPPTTAAISPLPDPVCRAREDYSLTVEQYDIARKRFPASLVAGLCGFREMEPLPRRAAEGNPAAYDKPA